MKEIKQINPSRATQRSEKSGSYMDAYFAALRARLGAR